MEAGKKLDERVATEVMGWSPSAPMGGRSGEPDLTSGWNTREGERMTTLPNFSTDVSVAEMVKERMKDLGFTEVFGKSLVIPAVANADVILQTSCFVKDRVVYGEAAAEGRALAICLAALKTIERTKENT